MKRFGKALLALVLAAVLLLGEGLLFSAPAEGIPGPARRTEHVSALRSDANRTDPVRLTARSRKKKTTATPQTEAEATPRPEEKSGEEPDGGGGPTATPVPEGPITDPQSIADYLFSHGMQLPDNFITKKEARQLGWDNSRNYVGDVAPGKSIGGDTFGNYEGRLPTGEGITYREADCYYSGKKRNAYRVVYSSDGRAWYTEDHYNTFTELFPTVP